MIACIVNAVDRFAIAQFSFLRSVLYNISVRRACSTDLFDSSTSEEKYQKNTLVIHEAPLNLTLADVEQVNSTCRPESMSFIRKFGMFNGTIVLKYPSEEEAKKALKIRYLEIDTRTVYLKLANPKKENKRVVTEAQPQQTT